MKKLGSADEGSVEPNVNRHCCLPRTLLTIALQLDWLALHNMRAVLGTWVPGRLVPGCLGILGKVNMVSWKQGWHDGAEKDISKVTFNTPMPSLMMTLMQMMIMKKWFDRDMCLDWAVDADSKHSDLEQTGCLLSAIDLNDGQFLIAMRCRCLFYNNDAMSMFLAISYHRNRCDYF